jgi:arginine-tRNA-protein transferase
LCILFTIFRLDANEYHLTKGQKKVLSKFSRYISGDWSPDGKEDMVIDDTKKKSKKNPPKSFLDLVQDAEKSDQKHKFEVSTKEEGSVFNLFLTKKQWGRLCWNLHHLQRKSTNYTRIIKSMYITMNLKKCLNVALNDFYAIHL